jgi:hypothetical protein
LTSANGSFISALSAVTSVTYKTTSRGAFGTNSIDALESEATGHGPPLRQHGQPVRLHLTPPSTAGYTLFVTLASGQVFPAYFKLS